MDALPTGTVTFLFTDLEGSTRLWEEDRDAMAAAVARHHVLLQEAIGSHGGVVFSYGGDGVAAAFGSAPDAVSAAADAQRALTDEVWDLPRPLRSRMGLHTGDGRVIGDQYESHPLNRCARLMSVAHGGQIVISGATAALLSGELPAGVELVDMGEHRLRDLQSSVHVFQVNAPGLASQFPPLRSLDSRPGNLPRQVTTFVGREAEIESLAELVLQSSLVTLTGVGGVGKTRLALQVAAEAVAEFGHGAWLCECAPVTDPEAVWETLAATLRVQPFPTRSLEESVLEYLAAKRLLLVLDNCEHLLDPIARQVAALAQGCAGVAVLATSREGLGVRGERMVAVPSLAVPVADADIDALMAAEAVELFSDRARAAKNDFVLTVHNAGAVGVLCRRLDGIPLAIELAAARVRSLSPDDLVARLDQRFKLLTRGSRAALERHQTLRSTIDWSYDLLDPTERHALDCLSVFAGSCDLAAAEAVLAGDDLDPLDVVDVLGQLVDKSLVVADADETGGVRYRLFESIRQYAQERLQDRGHTAAIRRRHADHYVEVAEAAGPNLRSREQIEYAAWVLRDIDNFRAVLDWAVELPSPEHALRLIAPLTVTGVAIGDAAMDWAEIACTIPGGEEHPLFAIVASWAAWNATRRGDFERAEARVAAAERSQVARGDASPAIARARATLAYFRNEHEAAVRYAEDWVDIVRASADDYELAHALNMFAGARFSIDYEAAIATWEEAVQVARDAGVWSALSISTSVLAGMLPLEESDRAIALQDEAIALGTRLGDRMSVAQVTLGLGVVAMLRGEWRTALRAALDSLEQKLELGDLVTIFPNFHVAGSAFSGLGYFEPAAVLIGKADSMFERPLVHHRAAEMLAAIDASLLEALGEHEVAILAARGAALDALQAAAYLRTYADLALEQDAGTP